MEESPERNNLAALQTNLIHRMGVLFGVSATLLGGATGALAGKLSNRFSAKLGFVCGAVTFGAWTSTVQVVNLMRIKKASQDRSLAGGSETPLLR